MGIRKTKESTTKQHKTTKRALHQRSTFADLDRISIYANSGNVQHTHVLNSETVFCNITENYFLKDKKKRYSRDDTRSKVDNIMAKQRKSITSAIRVRANAKTCNVRTCSLRK